jgi:hypothetical protein
MSGSPAETTAHNCGLKYETVRISAVADLIEAAGLRSARYSRINGTNRTGAMIVVVAVPSACFAKTMSS